MRVVKSLVCLLCLSAVPASADPLLNVGSRSLLSNWLGVPAATFTLTAAKPDPVTNDFWLALEGRGPSILLYEAIVGSTTYLVGGYSDVSFDRNNVEHTDDGRELSPGRHYSFSNADRDAFIFNLSTDTVLRERPSSDVSLVWFMDSGYGIEFGSGDLAATGRQLSSGRARAGNFGSGSHNLFGQSGTTSFTIGRLEVYSVVPNRVPEPTSLMLMGAAVPLYAVLRRRRRR